MIDLIFTVDYEIYGNGTGSLRELVYEPAEQLMTIFKKWDVRFVAFVEIAELEMIDSQGTDEAIQLVKKQIRNFYLEGVELGLHLHPQWYGARNESGHWVLDYGEYNLCELSGERISQIIDRSLAYFRNLLDASDFTPASFRAGNWLFQPARTVSDNLSNYNIKIDSSVFKGGRQHQHKLDYRRALRNGYYWTFRDDVNIPDPQAVMLELPIYTQMIPFWKMLTGKRVQLQRKGSQAAKIGLQKRIHRVRDLLRFNYPLKLDFCRMTLNELTRMVDGIIREDSGDTKTYRPIVAIGHTKDLIDFDALESFLGYLKNKGISISTLKGAYPRCMSNRISKS